MILEDIHIDGREAMLVYVMRSERYEMLLKYINDDITHAEPMKPNRKEINRK
jgi:hypothetical protein